MAKLERQFSRTAATSSAVAEEDGFDEVFRPHAVSRPRPTSSYTEAGGSRPELEDDDELPLPRTRRRVPVKRGPLPKGRFGRILVFVGMTAAFCMLIAACLAVHSFFMTDARFRIDSASSIQVLGNSQVTRPELLSVFGGDIGRNVFHVPLAARRADLEQLPWVEHATVMRLLPNQLRVAVTERIPVAFVRAGNRIGLVDKLGVLLDMPPAMMAAKRYSFPVVTGVTDQQSAEERAARMRLYAGFMSALDSTGEKAGAQLSEVDLSDPEDVRVLLPSAGTDLLVHFGSEEFAARWQRLVQKLPGWRQQYPRLAGVDLRYQRQTVLEMAKPVTDENASADRTPAHASPHSQTAATRPATLSHAAIQHGRNPRARPVVKKPAVKKKPTHSTVAVPPATTHRGTRA